MLLTVLLQLCFRITLCIDKYRTIYYNNSRGFCRKIKKEGGVIMNGIVLKKDFMSQGMMGAFGLIF